VKTFAYKNFINRELSWLEFNLRVLEETYDELNPLLEKLKFLAITASNLDEFFMVRVAGLKEQVKAHFYAKDISGLTSLDQIKKISDKTHFLITKQYHVYNKFLLPQLKNEDINIYTYDTLVGLQKKYIDDYFEDIIFPILTPLAIDSSRPFPLLKNKAIYIAVNLDVTDENKTAFIQLPTVFPRIIKIPEGLNNYSYIFAEEIICKNLNKLFKGNKINSYTTFRITRSADLLFDEEGAEDLLIEIEKQIKQRKLGEPVRLEIQKGCSSLLKSFLLSSFPIKKEDVYYCDGPLDLSHLMSFATSFYQYDTLFYKHNTPINPLLGKDMFKEIASKDILLHLPYQSFKPIITLLQQASIDDGVLAIKQTLYRVSSDSPIIKALITAAKNDKQVTVLVELKARFDEENNITWARKLEEAGCHVIYGLPNLKIHSKTLLIVRKERAGIKRYMHFSTGNYNDKTAKLYTDISFFTTRESLANDISSFFNFLTGYTEKPIMNKLVTSPTHTRAFFEKKLDDEINNVKAGVKGHFIGVMNSLVDRKLIEKFYEASCAGVKIQLLVRGVCCLKPKVKNVSENISVISIVGRYLEHTRLYYFHNNNSPLVYLGSADLMPRNLDRRVEVLFPIEEPLLIKSILNIINMQLSDTTKARYLKSDGTYSYFKHRTNNSQQLLYNYYASQETMD